MKRNLESVDASHIPRKKPKKEITFQSLKLLPELCQACEDLGWTTPTEIQEKGIPLCLDEKDVIGLAETGSGKTGAFALPALQHLYNNPNSKHIHTVVLAPTRELAVQIAEAFAALGSGIGARVVTIIGGVDRTTQAVALAKRPHVIVASPGRLVDHLENTKGFNLKHLKFLIFDEADQLLNMDFEKDINKIIAVIPRERRTLLFSATMTSKVNKLRRAALQAPVKVEVAKKFQTVKTLVQEYVLAPAKHKDVYTAWLMNEFAGKTMIIFCQTVRACQKLALILRNLGYTAIPLHGKLNQSKRLAALNKFKGGMRNILIATDVAARGLDIPTVDIVLNYDMPSSPKVYVHRVGRTARAGRTGRALTIVTQYDLEMFQKIEKLTKQRMPTHNIAKDEAMLLSNSVSEATRLATLEIREADEKLLEKKKKKKKKATTGFGF